MWLEANKVRNILSVTSTGTLGVGVPFVTGMKNRRAKQTIFSAAKTIMAKYLFNS